MDPTTNPVNKLMISNDVATFSFKEILEYLNDLIRHDAVAMRQLTLECKVHCNYNLANHPTVEVRRHMPGTGRGYAYTVGMLGILNGMFRAKFNKTICTYYEQVCSRTMDYHGMEFNEAKDKCTVCGAPLTIGSLVGFGEYNKKMPEEVVERFNLLFEAKRGLVKPAQEDVVDGEFEIGDERNRGTGTIIEATPT